MYLSFCKSKECINSDEYTEVKLNSTCDCTVWEKKRAQGLLGPGPCVSTLTVLCSALACWDVLRARDLPVEPACVNPSVDGLPCSFSGCSAEAEGQAGLSLEPTGSRSLGGLKSACHSEPNTDIFLMII